MNTVQKETSLKLLATGAQLMFVEYRGSQVREARKFIDGRASLSEKSYYVQHLVEAGLKPCVIEEPLPESFKPTDTPPAIAKRGQTALFEVVSASVFNGKTTYRGKWHCIA